MKKSIAVFLGLILVAGAAFAVDQVTEDGAKSYSWRYKMTVTVETPEGDVSGSAVRQMGNNYQVTFPAEASNYGEVAGEAVVVDLGKRGVVFALISDTSDHEFYATFPTPWGSGPETPRGYEYYDTLPAGTEAAIGTYRYLKIVTFTDTNDPKSVELVFDREICAWAKEPQPECDGRKGTYTVADRFEELFGDGVKLKDITLEITDEPLTSGVVDEYLSENFWKKYGDWMKSMDIYERGRTQSFGKINFKDGIAK